jgi:membrane protein implicated in regulation of membrane protease activity
MLTPAILVLAFATALSGVPSMASATADGAAAEPSLDGTTVTVAAGLAAVTIGGIVLLVTRRRGTGRRLSPAAQRRAEAIEENVTAALTRRTLHRGRLRLDDEVMSGAHRAPAPASRARAKRRSR